MLYQTYGNTIRIRVMGCLVHKDKILLLKHIGIGKMGHYWLPPGGGVNRGETIEECLKREILEEVSLTVKAEKLISIEEYINPPLHAIEYYFKISCKNPNVVLGHDPELPANSQTIIEFRWFNENELRNLHINECPTFIKELKFK